MNKIFLIGDIHGDGKLLSSKNFPEGKDLTKDDVVIQLGDFGLYWATVPSSEETYWLDWITEKPFTFAFLDGNHDNFDIIDNLPEVEKWGGKVGIDKRKHGDIIHLKRGEVYNINGKSFFVMGGALSIDKHLRTEGFSWWPQEQHSKAQETNALDNLDGINWKVDHVLSHTCPDSVIYAFLDNPNSEKFRDPVSRFLEFIANRLDFKSWELGHFHNAREYRDAAGDLYTCHWGLPKELK